MFPACERQLLFVSILNKQVQILLLVVLQLLLFDSRIADDSLQLPVVLFSKRPSTFRIFVVDFFSAE